MAGRPGPALARRRGPQDRVGQHAPHVGMVVDGVVLVARAEVEDAPRAAVEAAAAAEHLAAGEGGDEDELVRRRDVEVLAVHLLGLDDDRVRDAGGDGMRGVDRPDQLALALVAPAQGAARCPAGGGRSWSSGRSAARAGPCRRARRRAPGRRRRRRPRRGRRAPTRSARPWPRSPRRRGRAPAARASRCARRTRSPSRSLEAGGDRRVHPVGVDGAHVRPPCARGRSRPTPSRGGAAVRSRP